MIRNIFFNDTASTEIYSLSLHDALPISHLSLHPVSSRTSPSSYRLSLRPCFHQVSRRIGARTRYRSEEHMSELQSPDHLVCRLLLAISNTTWLRIKSYWTSA